MILAAYIALGPGAQAVGDQVVDGIAADIAIGGNLFASGSQKLVDRQVGVAAGQIPQHAVDQVDGPAAGVEEALRVPQLLPDMLAVEGVDAADQWADPRFEILALPLQLGAGNTRAEGGLGV